MSKEIVKESAGEAARETQEAQWCLERVKALEILTPEDFTLAAELAKGARANWKRLDERRTAITKPILDSKRRVDDLFKPALVALKEIEDTLKDKIGAYTSSQRKAQEAEMMTSAAEHQAGGMPTFEIREVPTAKGVSVQEHWDFEIVNPDLVPREYCSPDPAKIRAAIWYADTPRNPPRPIPGIEFKSKIATVVRVK